MLKLFLILQDLLKNKILLIHKLLSKFEENVALWKRGLEDVLAVVSGEAFDSLSNSYAHRKLVLISAFM